MRTFSLAALTSLLLVTTGCSTHPLPEDFSRKYTVDIVKKLRCEISEGVKALSVTSTAELKGTMIGFDFVFKMTENNNATAGKISLLDPFSRGQFTMDITGSAQKERHNERRFRMVDDMLTLRDEEGCSEADQRSNFIYPIAGHVGLHEVVGTYWKLKNVSDFDAYANEGKRAFIDKLLFTTILSAGISPNIKIESGPAKLHIANASFNGNLTRKDEHQVTVAVVQYVQETVKPGEKGRSKSWIPNGSEEPSRVVVPNPAAAAKAVNNALDDEAIRDNFRDYGFPFFSRD